MKTFPEIAQANLDNIDKLGAFTGKTKCRYDYGDGTHCAIGIAYPNTVPYENQYCSIHQADVRKVTGLEPGAGCVDYKYAERLQVQHDSICASHIGRNKREYRRFIARLLKEYNKEIAA